MDVTNYNFLSYEKNKKTLQDDEGQKQVIKKTNLQRALAQVKQALLKVNKKSPSMDVNSKIALAESYIKNGNYYEAEKIIRETAELMLPNPAKNSNINQEFLAKIEKKAYHHTGELENELKHIKQTFKKSNNRNQINAKIILAEAFIKNNDYAAAREVIQEASDLINGNSLENYTYQKNNQTKPRENFLKMKPNNSLAFQTHPTSDNGNSLINNLKLKAKTAVQVIKRSLS